MINSFFVSVKPQSFNNLILILIEKSYELFSRVQLFTFIVTQSRHLLSTLEYKMVTLNF